MCGELLYTTHYNSIITILQHIFTAYVHCRNYLFSFLLIPCNLYNLFWLFVIFLNFQMLLAYHLLNKLYSNYITSLYDFLLKVFPNINSIFIFYCFPVLPCPPRSTLSRCTTSSNIIFG